MFEEFVCQFVISAHIISCYYWQDTDIEEFWLDDDLTNISWLYVSKLKLLGKKDFLSQY